MVSSLGVQMGDWKRGGGSVLIQVQTFPSPWQLLALELNAGFRTCVDLLWRL